MSDPQTEPEVEDKVGHDGKLYLPVPHPLFDSPAEGSWGHRSNRAWKGLHFFLRGLYGTLVEWGVSWMDLVLEYPRVAVAMLLVVGITLEETMSDKPMLSGTYHYVLYTLDPKAADAIFPPETTTSEAELAIDALSATIVKDASSNYYNSAQYHLLEAEVKADMHYQVASATYGLAGMTEQLDMLRASRESYLNRTRKALAEEAEDAEVIPPPMLVEEVDEPEVEEPEPEVEEVDEPEPEVEVFEEPSLDE